MGSGRWTDKAFKCYSEARGFSLDDRGAVSGDISNQDMFKSRGLDKDLDPKNVIRQCCDSEEHPNTVPVILALDVTGSMGQAAVEVAKTLNVVMTELYNKVKDVEFLIMGIGDMSCDRCPVQVSQFESDIRIADQLEKIYFEFGGGGNNFESYTLAWYFALNHTDIDAIKKRGKKGIIITMGDETLNPYIPKKGRYASMESVFGDTPEIDISTDDLYKEVKEKFECYHIHVDHSSYSGNQFNYIRKSYEDVIGTERLIQANLNNIAEKIIDIVSTNANQDVNTTGTTNVNDKGEIVW